MRVISVQYLDSDPPMVALVLVHHGVYRLLVGSGPVVAHAYLGDCWRWVSTEYPVPRPIVKQFECEPLGGWPAPPEPLPPPPRIPNPQAPIPPPTAVESMPVMGGYVGGTIISTAGFMVVVVLGGGEIAAGAAAWFGGAVGYDIGRALHHKLTRGPHEK